MTITRYPYYLADIDQEVVLEARDGMSDFKAIDEVLAKRSYARHGFTPQPGEHWLDLGVNVGSFSVWAAAHGATVTGWEPEPECFWQAVTNVEMNGLGELVKLRQAAAWPREVDEPATLYVNGARGNVWRSSLLHAWRGSTDVMVPIESIVPYWTEDVCVKMDVEGSELPILQELGGQRVKKLVFEYSFDILPDMADFKAIMRILERTYENVRGGPGAARLAEDRWVCRGPANGVNVFCW